MRSAYWTLLFWRATTLPVKMTRLSLPNRSILSESTVTGWLLPPFGPLAPGAGAAGAAGAGWSAFGGGAAARGWAAAAAATAIPARVKAAPLRLTAPRSEERGVGDAV